LDPASLNPIAPLPRTARKRVVVLLAPLKQHGCGTYCLIFTLEFKLIDSVTDCPSCCRRTAFGYACVFYLSLLGISAYLFSNYGAIATGACDRPVASAVLWSTIFCTAMYQAFFALLVVVFYDILNSTDHDFRSLQVTRRAL
jgi:hypothetical protein